MIISESGVVAMTAVSWLLTFMIDSTFLLGLVWLVGRATRFSPLQKEWFWKAGIVVSLVVPTLHTWALASGMGIESPWELRLGAMTDLSTPTMSPFESGFFWFVALPWVELILYTWILGTTWGLGSLWWRHRKFLRTLRPFREIVDPPTRRIAAGLANRFRLRDGLRLVESDGLWSPAVLYPDLICVPADVFVTLPLAEQGALLAHEMAHIERRDPAWRAVSEGLTRFFFFQPLLVVARNELRRNSEFLADQMASERTGAPRELAAALAQVASWLSPTRSLRATTALKSGSELVVRVRRILQKRLGASRSERIGMWRISGGIVLAVIAFGLPRVSVLADPINDEVSDVRYVPIERNPVEPISRDLSRDAGKGSASDFSVRDVRLVPLDEARR